MRKISWTVMGTVLALMIGFLLAPVHAAQPTDVFDGAVYTQPATNSGGLYQSSWLDPDGSDYDQYVWDNFTLSTDRQITKITWRGGYDPARFGYGGPVLDFTVAVYPSIAAGIQPDVINPPLFEYHTHGNANETLVGTYNGTNLYDYQFTLPQVFHATANTIYWVQIEAFQHGIPDWGITDATGGDGKYFRRIAYVGDIYYQSVNGDAAFALFATVSVTPTPTATSTATRTPTPTTPSCSTAPNAPTLLAPANKATVTKARITLKWSAPNCAKTYQVVIRRDNKKNGVWDSAQNLSKTKYKTIILTQGHNYFWRVQACNDKGCGPWSAYARFKFQ